MEVAVNPLRGVHDEEPLQRCVCVDGVAENRARESQSNRVHNRLLLQPSHHATG